MGHPSLASEFPHDNAEISLGTRWFCADLTGPASAFLLPYTPVPVAPYVLYFEDEDLPMEGPMQVDLSALPVGPGLVQVASPPPVSEGTETGEQNTAAEPAAFALFESALVRSLLSQGATRSAALVPLLLRLEALPAESLAKDVRLTLQSRGYLDGNARYTQKFRELCAGWCAVLRGASEDFSACGTTTLDRFGADLLAALLAVPATRADELRRELRKAGIAAFGVLEAA